MIIYEDFSLGETVYLKTDADQSPRLVTGILLAGDSDSMFYEYRIVCGTSEYWASRMELSKERDFLKTL